MADRVLIADDDQAVLKMMGRIVSENGFDAVLTTSGEGALNCLSKDDYALLLLDINMHGIDGFEVIRRIREKQMGLPIIVISGRKTDGDTVYGLDIGADDYITKPFNPVTLAAKIRAVIRRGKNSMPNLIAAGPFTYDTTTLKLYKNGEEIILSGKENAMMKLFLDNQGQLISKDMIYEMIWGGTLPDMNTIMVYINRLRQKIEDDPADPVYLQNVRGIGYRFKA